MPSTTTRSVGWKVAGLGYIVDGEPARPLSPHMGRAMANGRDPTVRTLRSLAGAAAMSIKGKAASEKLTRALINAAAP